MMAEKTAVLMRIFVDEDARLGRATLVDAIISELTRQHCCGATVLKGIEGFGVLNQLHTARSIDIASSLPVLIEVADSEENIRSVLPRLREMIGDGLITIERIRMRRLGNKT